MRDNERRHHIQNMLADIAILNALLPDLLHKWPALCSLGWPERKGDPNTRTSTSISTSSPTENYFTYPKGDSRALYKPKTDQEREQWDRDLKHTALAIRDLLATAQKVAYTPTRRPGPGEQTKCGNVYGCPDENWADHNALTEPRCHSCYEYKRRKGRDRRKTTAK